MVGKMTICRLVLIAAATALSGCASMEASAPAPLSSVQNAVYVVGSDNAGTKQASAEKMPPGESKSMRLYWFLGGR
jgi:hypothetical protein